MAIIEIIAAGAIALAIMLPFVAWYDKGKKELNDDERDK